MRKKGLAENQMSSVAFVEQAAWWSRELTRFRARGPGDLENAMRAIERDYAIDYWTTWRLRYRLSQVKDIGVTVYHRLQVAYRTEVERQQRKLELELECTRAIVGPDHPAVASAAALVDAAQRKAQARQGHAGMLAEDDQDSAG